MEFLKRKWHDSGERVQFWTPGSVPAFFNVPMRQLLIQFTYRIGRINPYTYIKSYIFKT